MDTKAHGLPRLNEEMCLVWRRENGKGGGTVLEKMITSLVSLNLTLIAAWKTLRFGTVRRKQTGSQDVAAWKPENLT